MLHRHSSSSKENKLRSISGLVGCEHDFPVSVGPHSMLLPGSSVLDLNHEIRKLNAGHSQDGPTSSAGVIKPDANGHNNIGGTATSSETSSGGNNLMKKEGPSGVSGSTPNENVAKITVNPDGKTNLVNDKEQGQSIGSTSTQSGGASPQQSQEELTKKALEESEKNEKLKQAVIGSNRIVQGPHGGLGLSGSLTEDSLTVKTSSSMGEVSSGVSSKSLLGSLAAKKGGSVHEDLMEKVGASNTVINTASSSTVNDGQVSLSNAQQAVSSDGISTKNINRGVQSDSATQSSSGTGNIIVSADSSGAVSSAGKGETSSSLGSAKDRVEQTQKKKSEAETLGELIAMSAHCSDPKTIIATAQHAFGLLDAVACIVMAMSVPFLGNNVCLKLLIVVRFSLIFNHMRCIKDCGQI